MLKMGKIFLFHSSTSVVVNWRPPPPLRRLADSGIRVSSSFSSLWRAFAVLVRRQTRTPRKCRFVCRLATRSYDFLQENNNGERPEQVGLWNDFQTAYKVRMVTVLLHISNPPPPPQETPDPYSGMTLIPECTLHQLPLKIQSLPASLLIWCSHQPPCLLHQGILLPGWRDSTALFCRLSPHKSCRNGKSILTFPSIEVGTTDTGVWCKWGIFPTNLHHPFPTLLFLRWEPVKRQFPTYSTGAFASSSPINSTKTSFEQLRIFTRKEAPFAIFFLICAFWHATRGTWGHCVAKKSRTPKEIC